MATRRVVLTRRWLGLFSFRLARDAEYCRAGIIYFLTMIDSDARHTTTGISVLFRTMEYATRVAALSVDAFALAFHQLLMALVLIFRPDARKCISLNYITHN